MFRVSRASAAALAVAIPAVEGAGGHFTPGSPSGVGATVPGYEWFERVQEELAYVVEQAGLVLSKVDNTQLRQAIAAMIAGAQKAVVISSAVFEASVSNGEVVRWDSGNSRFDEAIADGTANNLAVGVADVTNSKVYVFGETPALFSGLTPGGRYFLDATTPGALAASAPQDKVLIGIAKSATTMFIDVDPGGGERLPTGTVFHWPNPTPPSWALERDGSTGLSRATYAAMVALLINPRAGTVTIASPGVWTLNNHGFKAGTKVRLTTTGALPTGLAISTDYFVIAAGLTANNFQLSATAFSTAIVTTGSQSGVHTVLNHSVLGPGNGTTTFDMPDDRANFDRGWDDGRGLDTSRVFGSEQTDDVKSHVHAQQWLTGSGGLTGPTDGVTKAGVANTPTQNTLATGGTETRPRNRAYLPCIAY